MELMAQYAVSGVSGVVPKFLTPQTQALFRKGSLTAERHIIKASSAHQPFVALNEHLCMQVAAATGFATARTQVSEDGQVLVVERFDIDPDTGQRKGFEDFCSLLGLSPDHKYDSTDTRALASAAGVEELQPPPTFAATRLSESPLLAPRKRTRPTRPS
jgi:serine/threonine-protein kinase HipA